MSPEVLDWSLPRTPSPEALLQSLHDTGSVAIRNALDADMLARALAEQRRMFDLPVPVKMDHRSRDGTARTGYVPFGIEASNQGRPPDPKEIWHISRERIVENIWPATLPEFRTAMRRLWSDLDSFTIRFMALLGRSLGCEEYAGALIGEHNSILRLIRYGADSTNELAGAHRDVGLFTIHLIAPNTGYEARIGGQWRSFGFSQGTVMVSAGDMLEHISNGYIPSVEHRVSTGPQGPGHRHFAGYFVHPHPAGILKAHPRAGEQARFKDTPNLHILDQRARAIRISP